MEGKHILKICAAIFALYLCVYYWPAVSGLLGVMLGAFKPVFIGLALAYLLNILLSFYERHFFTNSENRKVQKIRRPVCLILAVATLLAVLALIMRLILPQLLSCIKLLAAEIPIAASRLLEQLKHTELLSNAVIDPITSIDWPSKIGEILGTVTSGLTNVMGGVLSIASSVFSGVATAFLSFIFAVYFLLDKDKLCSQCKRLLQRYLGTVKYEKIHLLFWDIHDCFHRFVVGQCTEAVILGALCAGGMLLLNLPNAWMIGALTTVCALVPIVGAFISGGIGAFLIFMESPMQALIFLIFIIILQQVEGDLIYPRIVGSSVGLPGVWVLTAVTVGGGIFGILGMLFSVPLAAAIYRFLKNDLNQPTNNSDHTSVVKVRRKSRILGEK